METAQEMTLDELRRDILRCLGRDYLAAVSDDYGLQVADRRSIIAYVDAIDRAGIPLDEILRPLTRNELKAICDGLGLDSRGREKEPLIERIVGLLAPKKTFVDRVTGLFFGSNVKADSRQEPSIKNQRETPKNPRSTLFVSYSHSDSHWLDILRVHLKPLEKQGLIELWDDTRIEAGMKWREEIERAIAKARIAVLMISPHFLASDFITNNELPPLLEIAERDGLVVVPVIASPCRFTKTPGISRYQALNDPNRTLEDMSDADRGRVFVKLADRIEHHLSR